MIVQPIERINGVLVWMPVWEGITHKDHLAVVRQFQDKHKGEDYVVFSMAIYQKKAKKVEALR